MRFNKFLSTSLVILISVISNAAIACDSSKNAAMIIRLNSDAMYYDNALKKVTERALHLKPSVEFTVCAVIKNVEDPSTSEDLKNEGFFQAQKVVNLLSKFGVSKDNIYTSYENTSDINFTEIRIFVN